MLVWVYETVIFASLPYFVIITPTCTHTHSHPHTQFQIFGIIKKSTVDDLPSSFDDCIVWARNLFSEYFERTIAQLLHVFPPNHVSCSDIASDHVSRSDIASDHVSRSDIASDHVSRSCIVTPASKSLYLLFFASIFLFEIIKLEAYLSLLMFFSEHYHWSAILVRP